MKRQLVVIGTIVSMLSAAIVVHATEGQWYQKVDSVNANTCKAAADETSCTAQGPCNINVTWHWDCNGQTQDPCTPSPTYQTPLPGNCGWVVVFTKPDGTKIYNCMCQ